jgi:hypothetical protein
VRGASGGFGPGEEVPDLDIFNCGLGTTVIILSKSDLFRFDFLMGLMKGDSSLSLWFFSFRLGKEMVVYSPEANSIVQLCFLYGFAEGLHFLELYSLLLNFGALFESDLDEVGNVILEANDCFKDMGKGLVS